MLIINYKKCNHPYYNLNGGNDELKIKFDDIKIIRKLGTGMFGSVYEVVYNNKKYALKIQHILPKDKIKNFNNDIWREFDVYNYINTLDEDDQLFFTKLYSYKIYNKCKHIQKRPYKINLDNNKDEFSRKLKKLDKSNWCVKYLLDYKGSATLETFLQKNKLTLGQVYSLCLQICKIIYVLYKGGYSHNDLHPGNIIVSKTNKKSFYFMDKKISYEGYQLISIDYGEVLNKKFGIKYDGYKKKFLLDRKNWMFNETFYCTFFVIDGLSKNIADCKKLKKKLPWERKGNTYDVATIKMLTEHKNFYKTVKNKYIQQFPKGEKLMNFVANNISQIKSINETVFKKKNEKFFWDIINRIVYEFQLLFPKKYAEYWLWPTYHKMLLPVDVTKKLLSMNNYEDYINCLTYYYQK